MGIENEALVANGEVASSYSKTGAGVDRRIYIGDIFDQSTGLNYLQARYQSPARGQFLSEDPVFLGNPVQQQLTNPQSLNSYSYANDNPITQKDPSGNLGVNTVPTTASSFVSSSINTAASLAGFVYGIFTDPSGAVITISGSGQAGANQLRATLQNPGSSAKSAYNSVASQWQTFWSSSDAQQGTMLGPTLSFGAFSLIPGGAENDAIKAGDQLFGLGVTKHAAEDFAERGMSAEQIKTALDSGTKYLDKNTGNLLHVVGEQGKGGYTVVTDISQKTLVTVQNFIQNLNPGRYTKLN